MNCQTGGYRLHFTQPITSQPDLSFGTLTTDLALYLALPTGLPFFLTNHGEYVADLNAFFRSLLTDGCHSHHTWRAYAQDIDAYLHFLHQVRHIHWLDATHKDLAHYRLVRRGPDAEQYGVKLSGKSWNRALAALDRLYRYATEEGWIVKSPFRYKSHVVTGHSGHGGAQTVQSNKLRDPEHGEEIVKCITLEEYRIFREVGLRGLLPDGMNDPTFSGKNGTRNALFADLLVETGLRIQEGAALLVWEMPQIPTRSTAAMSVKISLASAIAKRKKGRPIRINVRLLRRIQDYIAIERENIMVAAKIAPMQNARLVRRISATRYLDEAKRLRQAISEATPLSRRWFVEHDEKGAPQPVALWLGNRAQMLSEEAWRSIFADASARCTALGFPMEVSPHTLRHTFAVYMLQCLIEAILSKTDAAAIRTNPGAAKYRRLIGDPLRILQKMLGHSSIESTYKYLTSLDEAVEIIDIAVDAWVRDLQEQME